MSRKPRIIVPGQIYQVTSHGVDGLEMFQSRDMRSEFLKLLDKFLQEFSISCYTYAFTTNHYYLVLRSPSEKPISAFMQKLNSNFARRYNYLNGRHDAVVGRRYDCVVAKDDIGLSDLIRFVNLEPVRQCICTLDQLDSSAWSAHSVILGNKKKPFIDRQTVLKQFKTQDPGAAYREFIRDGFPDREDDEIVKLIRLANSGCGEQIILGDDEYIQKIHRMNQNRYAQVKRHISENMQIEKLHQKVNEFLCLEKDELFNQGRQNVKSTARELFAYIAAKRFDYNNAEIARYLRVCNSAVSRMISRFENIIEKEYLKSEIERLFSEDTEDIPI
ncbi:MAG: hypothetical protein GX640_10740 [Fibrobacter sp.]|nr:hypothetical protein [Fibrobacter sp.]